MIAQMAGIAVATLVSEDLACIAAGTLAAQAQLSLPSAILASFVGIVFGDLLLYAGGYFGGQTLLRFNFVRKYLSAEKLQNAERWFQKRGPLVVIFSRFVPGMRLPAYVAAGVVKMPVIRFTFLLIIAAAIWTPVFVGAAYHSGATLSGFFANRHSPLFWLGMILAMLIVWFALHILRHLATYKSRRMLYSKWQRLRRWEFWPMWVLYVPVGIYILYLGVKNRRLLAFTACNPGIPASGIRGESKSDILYKLSRKLRNFGSIAAFMRIEFNREKEPMHLAVQAGMKKLRLGFPVVLKPDAGERGTGVVIANSNADIASYVASVTGAFILQKYIPGREYGIFYYRYPTEPKGRILAITDKRLITLTGDGVSDLETLILRDDRAVLMAKFHLERLKAQLKTVIPSGKIFPLVQLGTHCKGALFLDGERFISEKLTDRIDKISANFKGFFFGRYDIRVHSEADLTQGKNLKVLELNGVTSEATSIYDPQHSIGHAYRMLFRQWRIASEIGAQNIGNGEKPVAFREFLRIAI